MNARLAVVTGGGHGIGAATARHFAAQGWRVGLLDLDGAAAAAVAQSLGQDQARAAQADVRDADRLGAALAALVDWHGHGLDVMVNNAGVLTVGRFEEIDPTAHDAMVDVNLKGAIHGARAAFPHLKDTRGARLINVCSVSALYGAPEFAVYGATKFAVRGLTEALNIEWAPHDIWVADVMPHFTDTRMLTGLDRIPGTLARFGAQHTPADVAALIHRAATGRRKVHWLPRSDLAALKVVGGIAGLARPLMRRLSGF